MEKAIEKTEAEITEMEETINDPANGTNVELLLELSKKKEEAEAKLEELYTEWEELQDNEWHNDVNFLKNNRFFSRIVRKVFWYNN